MSRLPQPPPDADERATLLGFLAHARAVALRLVEDLDDDQARHIGAPPLTSLLGTVKHLTDVELWWFQHIWAGTDPDLVSTDDDLDADWHVLPDDTIEAVTARYCAACDANDDLLRGGDLDAPSARPSNRGHHVSLRWVGWHLVEETSRHNGQGDVIRQAIDGLTSID